MTDREKLIELLTAYYGADPAYYAELTKTPSSVPTAEQT